MKRETEQFKHDYLPLQPAMQRMAEHLIGNEDEAADVVQDCFVTLWNDREKLRHVVNREAWCIMLVKRRCVDLLRKRKPTVEIGYFQSNIEGELIDRIQQVGFEANGLIVNCGGYSHSSVALRDALLAVPAPAVEVHSSNIFAREDYRHHSFITSACRGMICGLGLQGYELAIRALTSEQEHE